MRPAGIYKDVPKEEYHSEEGISNSSMGYILDCGARYKYEKERKKTDEEMKKFIIGQAVHTLILEPELFEETFLIAEKPRGNSKEAKKAKEAGRRTFIAEDGRTILTPKEYDECHKMAIEGSSNSVWTKVKMSEGNIENSIYWDIKCEDLNFSVYIARLRACPDFFNNKIIIDVKTTESIKKFQQSVESFGYYRQAAMQIDALSTIDNKERKFFFLAIEKKPPYLTKTFDIEDEYIEIGRKEYKKAALIYAKCLKSNEWPGYDEIEMPIETIRVPKHRNKGDDHDYE